MSNSSLVSYTALSPNHSGKRTHAIDRITPHCFVGQVTAKRGVDVFLPTEKKASCQYVIGKDGDVGLACDEANRSWCTSSNENDQRAITIEVASDNYAPFAFTEAAYTTLVNLCADICQRNGKTKLLWLENKEKTLAYEPAANEMVLTVHRWFANKSCPGDWMFERMGNLAAAVNSKLSGGSVALPEGTFAEGATGGENGYGYVTDDRIFKGEAGEWKQHVEWSKNSDGTDKITFGDSSRKQNNDVNCFSFYLPSGYDGKTRFPLIMWAPGDGENRSNSSHADKSLADNKPAHLMVNMDKAIVVVYHAIRKPDNPTKSKEQFITLTKAFKEHYAVDPKRIYAGGGSGGGYCSIAAVAEAPELYASYYMFATPASLDNTKARIFASHKIRVYFCVGANDGYKKGMATGRDNLRAAYGSDADSYVRWTEVAEHNHNNICGWADGDTEGIGWWTGVSKTGGGSYNYGDNVQYGDNAASTDGGNYVPSTTYSINATAVKEMVTDLFNWNIKNNVFENGTIVVKGKAKYKVGQRVLVKSTGIEYYVESVSHNFNCYGTWTTSLGVTRGIAPDQRFTKPWGCGEEMTYNVMSAIVQQTSGAAIDWNNLPEVPVDGYNGSGGVNNTPLWYPSIGGGQPVTSGTLLQNEKGCYEFLTETMGLNHAAASGALANINAESGFDTGAHGDNGTSYGICQWHNGRKTQVQDYCVSKGYSIDSLQGQLEWMLIELSGSYYGHVLRHLQGVPNTAEGAYSAASYWCIHFEVPQDRYNVAVSRGNVAKNEYFVKSY